MIFPADALRPGKAFAASPPEPVESRSDIARRSRERAAARLEVRCNARDVRYPIGIRECAPPVRPRGQDPEADEESDRGDQGTAPCDRGPASRPDGRREHRDLHGLPGAAQHRPRTRQGRRAIPSRRDARRGEGARPLDDLQVRGRQHPDGRRQGGRHRRSQEALPFRTRASLPALLRRDDRSLRRRQGHSRPGREHGTAGDGLVHGHLLDAPPGVPSGGRDRQADRAGRQPGTRDRDGGRRHDLHPRGGPASEDGARRRAGGRAGVRQRRQLHGLELEPATAARSSRSPTKREATCARTEST